MTAAASDYGECLADGWTRDDGKVRAVCGEPANVPVVLTAGQTGPLPYPLSVHTEIRFACWGHAVAMVDLLAMPVRRRGSL